MLVQYAYALSTMVPCPLWFWYRWASATFLLSVFVWSIYNGATYYIDVFGRRFQNELEQLRRDVAKWQSSPDLSTSPLLTPRAEEGATTPQPLSSAAAAAVALDGMLDGNVRHARTSSLDSIPLLDSKHAESSGLQSVLADGVRERK